MRFLKTAFLALLAMGAAAPAVQAQGTTGGFTGAGSTLAYPMLQRWERSLAPRDGEGRPQVDTENGLDYEAVGSVAGMARVIQRAVDFGATDVPLAAAELERFGLVQFPIVTGGIAVVTNIRGAANIRLSGDVLARIYLGQVTRWSDPALRELNPGLTLPDADIAVIRRGDGSGTTHHFTTYLAAANAEWRGRFGASAEPAWTIGTAVRGNAAVAERVRATENAIGYVEASQAVRLGLSPALVQNRAGAFTAPGLAALQAAPDSAEAYPIMATVHVLMPRRPASVARSRRTLEFFRLALEEGSDDARRLGFVPLPPAQVREVVASWRANIQGAR